MDSGVLLNENLKLLLGIYYRRLIPDVDITLVQVFRQSVNLKDEENSFSQSANRLCPIRGSLSPLCLLQNGTKLQYLMYIHMQGYFRWLGLLGPGPMLGRHVNVCATNYIRLCTRLYGVSPSDLIHSPQKSI